MLSPWLVGLLQLAPLLLTVILALPACKTNKKSNSQRSKPMPKSRLPGLGKTATATTTTTKTKTTTSSREQKQSEEREQSKKGKKGKDEENAALKWDAPPSEKEPEATDLADDPKEVNPLLDKTIQSKLMHVDKTKRTEVTKTENSERQTSMVPQKTQSSSIHSSLQQLLKPTEPAAAATEEAKSSTKTSKEPNPDSEKYLADGMNASKKPPTQLVERSMRKKGQPASSRRKKSAYL